MRRSGRENASLRDSSLGDCAQFERSTFCVVCGHFSADLVLRKSGLKCAGCVGKSSNKQWVRLQHRQAHELLSIATARGRRLSFSNMTSSEEMVYDSSALDSDEFPSQLISSSRPVDACGVHSTRRDEPVEEQSPQPHIRDYIANTACYQAAAADFSVRESLMSARTVSAGSSKVPTPGTWEGSASAKAHSRTGVRRRKAPVPSPPHTAQGTPCNPSNKGDEDHSGSATLAQMLRMHNAALLNDPTAPHVASSYLSDTVVEATEAAVLDDAEADPHYTELEIPCADECVGPPHSARQSSESVLQEVGGPKSAPATPHASEAKDPPPTPAVRGSSAVNSSRDNDAQEDSLPSSALNERRHVSVPTMSAVSRTMQVPEKKPAAGQSRVVTPVTMNKTSQHMQSQQQTSYVDPTSRHFSRCDARTKEPIVSSSSLAYSSSLSDPVEERSSASLIPSDTTKDVPIVNLDRLSVAVELMQLQDLSEESSSPTVPVSATSHRIPSGSSINRSNSGGIAASRVASPVGSKFTVTRHFSSAHQKQENSGGSLPTSRCSDRRVLGDGLSASRRRRVNASVQDTFDAKKISFLLVVRDRDTNNDIRAVKRRYFGELTRVFEELKTIMHSLPALPNRRVPSTRQVNSTYVAELREECQVFMDAVAQNHFLIRHPKVLDLLRLEFYMYQPKSSLLDQRVQFPEDQSQEEHQNRKGFLSKGLSSAAEGQGSTKFLVNGKSLKQLSPNLSARGFARQASDLSCVSTNSSVIRRGAMDAVCVEDLERVQLGNWIGSGTFGKIYLGLLSGSSAVVAVKVVQVNENVEKDFLLSLRKELDVLRAARHRNIIRFLGSTYLERERELRVFTEYVECGDVPSMVKKFGCLPLLVIQKYMTEIIRGLHYLHQMAIVHRDIKGENILITKKGCCKLADFGCSGTLQEVEGRGGIQGSPMWMAPEIIQGASPATSGDIWALGCVGIEMLQRPIWNISSSMNPYVFLYCVGKCNSPPHGVPTEEELETYNKEGTREEYQSFKLYRDFLCRCLCMSPEERWSAAELAKHPFLHTPFEKRLRWMPPDAKPTEQST